MSTKTKVLAATAVPAALSEGLASALFRLSRAGSRIGRAAAPTSCSQTSRIISSTTSALTPATCVGLVPALSTG